MNVFLPNVHGTLTASLCRAFGELGVQVIVPGGDFGHPGPGSRGKPMLSGAVDFAGFELRPELANCHIVSLAEVLDLDVDLVLIAGASVQRSVLSHVLPVLARRRTVCLGWFCGNERPRYRWDLMQNLLCADASSWAQWGGRVANAVRYFPWIDYERFSWQGHSDTRKMVTCINNFAARYPAAAALTKRIVVGLDRVEHDVVEACPPARIAGVYSASAATLHVKPEEGYGYAVIESLACGRPVIAPRSYVQGRAMQQWCVQDKSALLFDTVEQARASLSRFFADIDLRHRLQESAAMLIRQPYGC